MDSALICVVWPNTTERRSRPDSSAVPCRAGRQRAWGERAILREQSLDSARDDSARSATALKR